MTSKTIKSFLFASLIAAMILPFSAMDFAEAQLTDVNGKDKTNEIMEHKKIIDEDVKTVNDLLNKINSLTSQIEELRTNSTDEKTQKDIQRLEAQLEKFTSEFNEKVVKHNQENNTPDVQIDKLIPLQDDFEQKLRSSDMLQYVTSVGIDLGTKEIQVGLDNSKLTTDSAVSISKQIGEMMPKNAKWHYVLTDRETNEVCNQQICTPLVGGNKIVSSTGSQCSVAFEATKLGVSGFVTAGHCVDGLVGSSVFDANTAFVGTVNSETRYSGTDCDCAFINTSPTAIDNKIWVGGSTRTITSYTSSSNQSDDFVWKSGYATGITNGQVTAINVTTYDFTFGWTDKLVRASYGSSGGDSGGSVYSGSSIYGVHVGSGLLGAVYSPTDKVISVLGASPVLG